MKKDQIPVIQFNTILKQPSTVFEPYPLNVQKAYDKICKLWNRDNKTKSFIKHLIIYTCK